ncbi:hypothetical protein [Urechidicola croceus]|uniref:Oligosaccharide repeat unit polymerase n=1 Tax=Urechidicola croceus TaxID=1850246 RepID=A0A1D8P9B6_9FLAO|nr:hypothetical protein [Urechidicola croceus]AOW21167.1 hypothetical protein LPB138_10970 [Urechidicola croceus]
MVVSIISLIIEGNYVINFLLSLYLVFSPFILLTFKSKAIGSYFENGFLKQFIKVFTFVLAIVNLSAFIFATIELSTAAYPEDVFTGLYGKGGFGSHSLSIINLVVSLYYFYNKKIKKFVLFLICGILGFYGLGLIILIFSISILGIPYLIKKTKLVLQTAALSMIFLGVIYTVNPKNIDYIALNISYVTDTFKSFKYEAEMDKVKNYERTFVPRYITFMYGTFKLYFSNPKVFVLGTSPGTYNSRTAFYLNGDLIASEFIKKNFNYKPTYHLKYVYPILNRKLLTSKKWNDGTRNQPFSSIITVFLEYGFIVGCLFFLIFFRKIRNIRKMTNSESAKNYIKFLSIFLIIFFIVQNHLEYPEIIIFFILVFKFIDIDNVNERFNNPVFSSKKYLE